MRIAVTGATGFIPDREGADWPWWPELESALSRHPNLDGPRFPRLAGLLAHHCIRAVHRPA